MCWGVGFSGGRLSQPINFLPSSSSIGLISWAVFLAFIAGGVKRRGDLVARFNRQRMQKTQYVQVTLYDPALRIIGGWGAVVAWYCLAMVPFVDRVIFKNQNWMFPTG